MKLILLSIIIGIVLYKVLLGYINKEIRRGNSYQGAYQLSSRNIDDGFDRSIMRFIKWMIIACIALILSIMIVYLSKELICLISS